MALDNPSWLVTEPGGVLAIGENQPSTVTLVASDLTAGPSVELSGEHACHAALYGDFLVVANYGSGSVSVVELDAAGAPVAETDHLVFSGSGPDADRQDAPHAHQIVVDGDSLLVCDLGTDRIHRLRLDAEGRLTTASDPIELPAGFGPRHLVRSGEAIVVLGELTPELWLGRFQGGSVTELARVPATSESGECFGSGLRLDADGLLWSANRGPDTIAVHRLDGDQLVRVTEFAAGGRWPRDLALIGDQLLVANQYSDDVTVFDRPAVLAGDTTPVRRIESVAPTAVLAD